MWQSSCEKKSPLWARGTSAPIARCGSPTKSWPTSCWSTSSRGSARQGARSARVGAGPGLRCHGHRIERLCADRGLRHRRHHGGFSAQARDVAATTSCSPTSRSSKKRRSRSVKHSPNCILIIVTNPLDAMCQAAHWVRSFRKTAWSAWRGPGHGALPHVHRTRAGVSRGKRHRRRDGRTRRHDGPAVVRLSNVAGIPLTELLDAGRHRASRAARRATAAPRS